jgi:phosphocarrier protein
MTLSAEYRVVNRLGLHARAAAQLVRTANRFKAEVLVAKDDEEVNGKSIMGLLMLAAPVGAMLRITVNGDDAEAALQAIGDLINDGFGEQ